MPDPSANVSVVCLHGLGRTPSDWNGVREGLSELGTVVSPQLPDDLDEAYRIAVEVTPPGAIVVGHSYGAVVAMRLAARPGSDVDRTVLTSAFFPPARNGRGTAVSVADYARHRVAFVSDLRTQGANRVDGRKPTRGISGLLRTALHRRHYEAMLDAIASPVVVVHACDDHYVPIDFAMAAARKRQWAKAVLEDGGHYPHVERPEQWLAAVNKSFARIAAPDQAGPPPT